MDGEVTERPELPELLKTMSPAQRLASALAWSDLVRDLAWQGAVRYAGHLGQAAVVDRFLRQLYGPKVAAWVAGQGAAALHGD